MEKYKKKDNIIYFSVTSNGRTGFEWIKYFKDNNYNIGDYSKSILISNDFKPTKGITTEVAVLKGMLFEDKNRITKNIHTEAEKRKLQKPNAEITCLVREKFSNEELEKMGLSAIVVMHEPIKDSGGAPHLLITYRYDDGRWLDAYYYDPDRRWDRECGFAFALSQVSALSLDTQSSLETLSLDLYCKCERCPHCKKLIK